MFDDLSFKVMLELVRDGRCSNAKLAQKLGISVLTVAKRREALIREGVVTIRAVPNPVKMGYQAKAFICLDVDLKKIDDICARLMENSHVNLVLTIFGRFDLLLLVYFREWGMLQSFIKEELPRIDGVNHIETYLVSELRKRYEGKFPEGFEPGKPPPIDEIDQKLIRELMKNGDPKYVDLANKLGISTSTVSRRVAALIKKDIFRIQAIPNPAKLGYSANAFVFLRTDLAKVEQICDQLCEYSEINLVMKLMNDYEVLFSVNSLNTRELYEFIKTRVANIDGVLNTETLIRGDFLYYSGDAMFLPSAGLPSE
jgi:DNA-binding Lrp family transcriptional regulator